MNFSELITVRQSDRAYLDKSVENEELEQILEAARLAPSACNGQPYLVTVCQGETAKKVAKCTQGMGMNNFATQAPVMLVLSEQPYVKSAALGAKLKHNDYRSIDIGILAAYITAQAADLGLGSCILGWFDDEKIRAICDLDTPVRLCITLGYPAGDTRSKKRKSKDQLIQYK